MAGNDANWGRVVMAVGKAGEHAMNRERLWIEFGQVRVAEMDAVTLDYSEVAATHAVSQTDVVLRVGVGIGEGQASVLTCDLTHGYISINGTIVHDGRIDWRRFDTARLRLSPFAATAEERLATIKALNTPAIAQQWVSTAHPFTDSDFDQLVHEHTAAGEDLHLWSVCTKNPISS